MKLDRNKPLLVTGAGGVLGKAVLALLEKEGFTRVLAPARSELDFLDGAATEKWFEKNHPAYVIHLASVVFGLGGNIKNQFRSVLENTSINTHFFSAVQRFPAEKIFFSGTVASYPFPYRTLPLAEEQFFEGMPHYGEFGYAMAKRHAFAFLHILQKEYGVKSTYGIFTNLYGAHDRFNVETGHVIPSLVAKAFAAKKANAPLEVWGDGSATRDFLHADDAARAVLLCMEEDNTPDFINISSGEAVTIGHVAKIIANAANVKELRFFKDKPVGIPERVVCNKKLRGLGFTQQVSHQDGLAGTYAWYEKFQKTAR